MHNLVPIIHRFSEYEFEINRRFARGPEFRAICEDYADATRALAYWEKDPSKAEDYHQLIKELEDEIFANLTRPPRSG